MAKAVSKVSTKSRLLTFEEAVEHPAIETAVRTKHNEWRERQNERLRPYKTWEVDNATLTAALHAEDEAEDPEPSAQSLLMGKLLDGSLPFFELDAIGNLVKGNRADLKRDRDRRRKRRPIFIYDDDLRKACGRPKIPPRRRGPPPEKTNRVAHDMRNDLQARRLNLNELKTEKQVALATRYHCHRETALDAREIVLSEFETPKNSDTK